MAGAGAEPEEPGQETEAEKLSKQSKHTHGVPPLAQVQHIDAVLRLQPVEGTGTCAADITLCRPGEAAGSATLHADCASLRVVSVHFVCTDGSEAEADWAWREAFAPSSIEPTSSSKQCASTCRNEAEKRVASLERGDLCIALPSGTSTLRVVYFIQPACSSGGACADGVMHIVPSAPCALSAWLPCNAEPRSRSTFHIVLDVPPSCSAIASGRPIDVYSTAGPAKEAASLSTHSHEHPLVLSTNSSNNMKVDQAHYSLVHDQSETKTVHSCKPESSWHSTEANRLRRAFSVDTPQPSCHIVIAAGHLVAAADEAVDGVQHFVPQAFQNALRLAKQTIELPLLVITEAAHIQQFSLIGMSYTQVFLPTESACGLRFAGLNISLLGADVLAEPQQVEAALEMRLLCSRLLAKQLYGVCLSAATPGDAWMLEGISRLFERKVLMSIAGENEALYRRYSDALAIREADDGALPPLAHSNGTPPAGWWQCTWEGCGPEGAEVVESKCELVMSILERKAGEDAMSRILRRMARMASKKKVINTEYLLEQLHGKHGGVEEGDVRSLAERYIYGSGCPSFHVAATYQKRKHVLEVGLREEGTRASKQGSLNARSAATANAWGASMTLRIQEQDGPHDHRVSLGANPFAYTELQLYTKREQTKKSAASKKSTAVHGKQKQKQKQKGQDAHAEDTTELEQERIDSPVEWMTLDPEKEWLIADIVHQPLRCWEAILEREKDATKQLQAVDRLEHFIRHSTSLAAVDALAAAMRRKAAFCRVRAAAAAALGRTTGQSTNWRGLAQLTDFFRMERMDLTSNVVLPPRLYDFSEHIVDCGVLEGLASVRDSHGQTPQECVDIVHDALEECSPPESPSERDDSATIAHMLSLLPLLRPPAEDAIESVIESIIRFLRRERAVRSPCATIGCAAMNALANVYASAKDFYELKSETVYEEIASAMRWAPAPLRRAGYSALLRIRLADGASPGTAVCDTALPALGQENSRQVQELAIWDSAEIAVRAFPQHREEQSQLNVPKELLKLACGHGQALASRLPLQLALSSLVHAFAGFAAPSPIGNWGQSLRDAAIGFQEPENLKATITLPLYNQHEQLQNGANAGFVNAVHNHESHSSLQGTTGLGTPEGVQVNETNLKPLYVPHVQNNGQDTSFGEGTSVRFEDGNAYDTPPNQQQHLANQRQQQKADDDDCLHVDVNGNSGNEKKRKRKHVDLPWPQEMGRELGIVMPELREYVPPGVAMDSGKGASIAFERMNEEGILLDSLKRGFELWIQEHCENDGENNVRRLKSKVEQRKAVIWAFGIPPETVTKDEVFMQSIKQAAKDLIASKDVQGSLVGESEQNINSNAGELRRYHVQPPQAPTVAESGNSNTPHTTAEQSPRAKAPKLKVANGSNPAKKVSLKVKRPEQQQQQ